MLKEEKGIQKCGCAYLWRVWISWWGYRERRGEDKPISSLLNPNPLPYTIAFLES